TAALFKHKLSKPQQIEHALSRLTFGAKPGEVEAVTKLGLNKWIDQQLNPASIAENPELESKLGLLPTLTLSTEQLAIQYPTPQILAAIASGRMKMPEDPALKETYELLSQRYKARIEAKGGTVPPRPPIAEVPRRRIGALTTEQRAQALKRIAPQQAVSGELTEAKIYRAVQSNRQLNEVLADFWFNHFNVFLDKGADKWLTTSYDRDAIRPNVLGHFSDLVKATAQSPAMLFYLDNWTSVAPEAGDRIRRVAPKARARGINENYARELMELHTLGVDGGYTQKDVQEVARCFTGWTIEEPNRGAKFRFAERVHDKGEKLVLGVKIPAGGGIEDGLKVIEILSAHPSTAKFISRKLAQRFVSDDPPQALIDRMAATFTKSSGDIKAVLRTMIQSPEFFSKGAYKAKMKSPFEMVAGALRSTNATLTNTLPAAQAIAGMGQPLYRKQEPTGYSNNGEEWLNSAGLLARINFAVALSENKLQGVTIDKDRYAELAKSMGAPEWQRR
ncbi:MAG: DUF1800 domain-containing protein, partial [Chloroflexia bacterium]